MNHHSLREVSKFLSGVMAAKVIFALWVVTSGIAPLILAGTPFTTDSIFPAMIFDVAALAILIYYGWHVKSPVHSPSERTLLLIAGVVFLLVAAIHAARLLLGWNVIVGDLDLPLWLSWVAVVFAVYIAYASFHFALRMRRAKSR